MQAPISFALPARHCPPFDDSMANKMGEICILLSVLRQIAERIGPDECDQWLAVPVNGTILCTSSSPIVSSATALTGLLFHGTGVDATIQAAHLDHFWNTKASSMSREEYLSSITSIDKSRIIQRKAGNSLVAFVINFSDQANCENRWINDGIVTSREGLPPFVRGAANICNSLYNCRLPTIESALITDEVEKYVVDSDYEHYASLRTPPDLNVIPDDSGDGAPQTTSRRLLALNTAILPGSPSTAPAIVTPRTNEQPALASDDDDAERRGDGRQNAARRHQRVEATAPSSDYISALRTCLSNQNNDEMKALPPFLNEMRLVSYILHRFFKSVESSSAELPHIDGRTGEPRHATMLPIKRTEKYIGDMVREIVDMIVLMTDHCGIDIDLVLQRLGKTIDQTKHFIVLPRMTLKEEIDFTIAAMNTLNTTGTRWHEFRMFVENTFLRTKRTGLRLGAPLAYIRAKRRKLAPQNEFYHGSSQFIVTGGASRTCRFWYARNPMQVIAALFEGALNNGEFEPSSMFCNAADSFAVVVTNIDRDTGTIGFVVRLANWAQGNSAHKCRTWAEMDSAAENHHNLSKFLLTAHDGYKNDLGVDDLPANPIHIVSQALYDDKLIEVSFELELKCGKRVWVTTCILNACQDGQGVPLASRTPDIFPDHIEEVEVDDDQHRRDSPHAFLLETADFSSLRLLIDKKSKTPIGVGTVEPGTNNIVTWSTFSSVLKNEAAFRGAKVIRFVFRRIIGAASDDGKMALIQQGSGGASSTYNCAKCLFRNHDGMDNIGKTFPLREEDHSPEACFLTYNSDPVPLTAQDKKDRSVDSFSITKKPIFRIHPLKIFGGTMHWRMGNAEKMDGCSVLSLQTIERETIVYEYAVEQSDLVDDEVDVVDAMVIYLKDDIGKRRKGISDLEKRMKDVQNDIAKGKGEENIPLLQEQESILEDDKKGLLPLEELCAYYQKYSAALTHASADLASYLGSDDDGSDSTGYLLLLLNESYLKAANVPLQGYFGGRTLIGRHVQRLLERYPLVCDYFLEAIKERCDDCFPVTLIEETLQKSAECMVELDIIAGFAEAQGKISPEEREELVESLKRYEGALKENYPDCHVSTKMHSYMAHLVETFDHWASVGRFNEQGFEAVHAFTNSFRAKFIRLVDPKLKADQVRQEVAARKHEGSTKLIETSNSMRAKRPREKKEATREQQAAINEGWARWSGIDRQPAETEVSADGEEVTGTSNDEHKDSTTAAESAAEASADGEEVAGTSNDDPQDSATDEECAPPYVDVESPDNLPNDGSAYRKLMKCPDCDDFVFCSLYLFHRTGRHGDCPNFHHLPEPLPYDNDDESSVLESRRGSTSSWDDDQGSLSSNDNSQSKEIRVVMKGIKKKEGHMPMLIAELEARGVKLSPEEKKATSKIGPLLQKLRGAIGEGVQAFRPMSAEMIDLAVSGKIDVETIE